MLNTIYTANKFQERSIKLLKPYGINDQHYNILRVLKGKNGRPTSLGEVKSVLLSTRGDLTRLIDKLVKMDLVDRSNSQEDRREVKLVITKKGLELIRSIDKDYTKNNVYEFKINEEEAKQLNKLLDKLRGE